jgi:hypothetical protein
MFRKRHRDSGAIETLHLTLGGFSLAFWVWWQSLLVRANEELSTLFHAWTWVGIGIGLLAGAIGTAHLIRTRGQRSAGKPGLRHLITLLGLPMPFLALMLFFGSTGQDPFWPLFLTMFFGGPVAAAVSLLWEIIRYWRGAEIMDERQPTDSKP